MKRTLLTAGIVALLGVAGAAQAGGDAQAGKAKAATCAGCHGLDAQGGRVDEEVLGEDAKDIRKAIRKEREMRFLRCLPGSDIRDIGSFLKNLEDDEDDDDDARGPRYGRGPRDGDDDDDDGDDD